MKSQFGEMFRILRNKNNQYLRQLAPLLEMGPGQLGRIGKVPRKWNKEQKRLTDEKIKVHIDELMTISLTYYIYAVDKDERKANETLQVAEKNKH